MSEYQNRAFDMLVTRYGMAQAQDIESCRDRFLKDALGAYRAMGGTVEDGAEIFRQVLEEPTPRLGEAIGEVMGSIAGLSMASDFDMMQVAYNTLAADESRRAMSRPRRLLGG